MKNGILIGVAVAATAAAIYFAMRKGSATPSPQSPGASTDNSSSEANTYAVNTIPLQKVNQILETSKSPFVQTQPVINKLIKSQTSPFIAIRTQSPAPVIETQSPEVYTPGQASSPSPIITQTDPVKTTTTSTTTTSPFSSVTRKQSLGLFGTQI